MRDGKVFNIPAGVDFLGTLAESLLNGSLIDDFKPMDDPQKLAKATVYVPNRRAARALATAFLSRFDGDAAILPEIRTLGDIDADEFGLFAEHDEPVLVKVSIQPIERKLQLARLIQSWRDSVITEMQGWFGDEELRIPSNPADSIRLAGDLSALLDQFTQEELDWKNVNDLIPKEHSDWWRLTSTFLQIIVRHWPDHLMQNDYVDPAQQATKLLKLRANRYQNSGSRGPVIIAGSTGSVPSTRMLLAAVATLRQGAIVLPGLDTDLGPLEWERLQNGELADDPLIESHSQFGLAHTLRQLEVERSSVIPLAAPNSTIADRNAVTSMALSLSELSSTWHEKISALGDATLENALKNVALIEAKNERQEALAVAIAMRETLEQENTATALVTPDRKLAYRVSMELRRYGIVVDDSAGTPLSETASANFARLVCRIGFGEYSSPELAALIKHPLFRAGHNPERARRYATFFEQAALRGTFQPPKIGRFENWVRNARNNDDEVITVSPNTRLKSFQDWEDALVWAGSVDRAFSPIAKRVYQNNQQTVASVFTELLNTVVRLTEDDHGNSSLNDESGANELSNLFESLTGVADNSFCFPSSEAPLVFDALLEDQVCRSFKATHSRLHIYGPLEARLLEHDRVILAGLNEDSWPRVHRNDSFLNRSMRRSLGMPTPERKTGLAAHDFQQLLATKEVILSRSARSDKAPTVASRWLQRITALIGHEQATRLRARGQQYLDWAAVLDQPSSEPARTGRPCVTPPIHARPKQLPVTEIETWVRDPYALYAKRVLQLHPLEPLEVQPDARIKGNIYHKVMENYVQCGGPKMHPTARAGFLRELWTVQLSQQNIPQDVEHIWQTRFHEVAEAYVDWEQRYQQNNPEYESHCEIPGWVEVDGTGFTLTARADRIDVFSNGAVHLFDYKTGNTPSPVQARTLSPQLALEAFIAERGGFKGVPDGSIADMRYLRLRTDNPIGKENIFSRDLSISDIVTKASDELRQLILAFQNLQQGYISRRAPFREGEMSGDYDHLARVREWTFGDEESE